MDYRGSRSLTTALLIAVFGTGLVLEREETFKARPSPPSGEATGSSALDGLTSYLWEDPLRVAPGESDLKNDLLISTRPSVEIEDATRPSYHLMMVMMRGEHWPENAEERLRTRFAVNAALAARDFVPTYPGRIFHQNVPVGEGASSTTMPIRFEWFQATASSSDRSGPRHVLVQWINESILQENPWESFRSAMYFAQVDGASSVEERLGRWQVSVIGPRSSDTLARVLNALLHEESIEKKRRDRRDPNGEIAARSSEDSGVRVVDVPEIQADLSNALRDLASPTAGPIRFFAGTPTVPLAQLVPPADLARLEGHLARPDAPKELCGIDHSLYLPAPEDGSRKDVIIYRTTTLDDALVTGILDELKLRGVKLRGNTKDAVVILAEQDSSYGRAWRDAFAREIIPDWTRESELPVNFVFKTWLRGLDGVLPGGSGGADLVERATGQRQLDYVTRLGNELEEREERIANEGGDIQAIGILGVDVYDKLLLLRELKARFPRAHFFVTDLDARLFSRESRSFTKNLLVASHFGLQFGGEFASLTAPFRGAYQSATYLATYLALEEEVDTELLHEMAPQIYEISRTGPYDLTAQAPGASRLQPEIPLGHATWTLQRVALAVLVFLIGVIFIGCVFNRFRLIVFGFLKSLRSDPITLTLFGGFLGILVLIGYDSSRRGGEPFLFIGGISVWPSFILQLVTGVLAIAMTRQAQRISRSLREDLLPALPLEDQKALAAQERAYAGTAAGLPLLADSSWGLKKRLGWYSRCLILHAREFLVQIKYLHEFSTRGKLDGCGVSQSTTQALPSTKRPTSSRPMQILLLLLNSRRRLYRVCGMTLAFLAFGLILFKLSQFPGIPYRGEISHVSLALSVAFAVITTNFLVLFVFDATQLARRAIMHLQDVTWSDEAAAHWCPEYENGQRANDALVSMRVTDHLATTTEKFIYYPFLGLLMMIVARSSIFDNWSWPWPLLVILSAAFGLAFLAGLLLRNAAKKLRADQLDSIRRRIDSLNRSTQSGSSQSTELVRLREAQNEIEATKSGAFGSWLSHPALQAALIPFGGMGTLNLLQAFLR